MAKPKKELGGCHDVKRVQIVKSELQILEKPTTESKDSPNWIAWTEEKLLGVPITYSKIDSCDISNANIKCKEFLAGKVSGFLVFAVEIQAIREFTIKKGKNAGKVMAFLTISDDTCSMQDVCVFSEVYEEYGGLLAQGNTVLIQGEKDKKKGSLIVKKVFQI